MKPNQPLLKAVLRYPLLAFLSATLGFTGAFFSGVGTILIVPVLLELLGSKAEFTKALPPALNIFFRVFEDIPDRYRLAAMATAVVLMIVLKNVCAYASALASGQLNRKLSTSLRREALKILLEVDLGFYANTRIGDHMAYLNNEVNRATSAISSLTKLVTTVITISVFVVMLILTSWKITLIAVAILGLIALTNQTFVQLSKGLGQEFTDAARAFSNKAIEMISGIRLIKANASEDREYAILDKIIDKRETVGFKSQLIISGIGPLNEILNILGLLLIAVLGRLVFTAQLEAFSSILLTYILILFRMLPYIGQLNASRSRLANTSPSVNIINDFLSRTNKPFMANGYHSFTTLEKGIHFDHISFKYPGTEDYVLNDVDLYLPKGKTLALVGASGAGKSTLADLLPRFYDCDVGAIKLDGVNIRDLNIKSFRQNLGIVSQDSFLFNASIRDNLSYGRPDATEADLIDAAKRANAYEFIVRLPQGLETMIGDRGILLSGGQKQRLAIARALLKNPDILILDEATSALDTISERLVQSAIDELSQDRTTLVIAHRLSTVQKADQIAVLDKGRVIEVGTHLELLQKGGAYNRLYAMQFSSSSSSQPNRRAMDTLNYKTVITQTSYELRTRLNTMIGVLGFIAHDVEGTIEEQEFVASAYTAALDSLSIIEKLERFEDRPPRSWPKGKESETTSPKTFQDQDSRAEQSSSPI